MTAVPKFHERKATEMACLFLDKHDRRMRYIKLLKLMYIVEREAILGWGRSVTFDSFVSMNHGPVLSGTYDLICYEPSPDEDSVFRRHIEKEGYFVKLKNATPGPGLLSPAERQVIDQAYADFGHMPWSHLVTHTHGFPEWEDPHGSSRPILIRTILQRNGKTAPEVDAILNELDGLAPK